MKKKYQAPTIKLIALQQRLHLMTASDTLRVTEGIDLPTQVGSTAESDNAVTFGKGQGYSTNRSREIDWDF